MCAGMTALQLQILGVGELLSGTPGHVMPVGVSMVLPPRVLMLPHIAGKVEEPLTAPAALSAELLVIRAMGLVPLFLS